jgi:nucleoside-diphosphate-sugar epimerase
MRVLVAGASGVIGQRLVRILAASGHVVTGTTRSPERATAIRAAGATPIVVNAFDAQQLGDAIDCARPEIVVHQLTDLPDRFDPSIVADTLARNARVRTEGTRNLVAAAVRAGARRLVAQSIAWAYAPGPEPHREDDPLDTDAEGIRRMTVSGAAELERLVTSVPRLEGLVLRYGQLYGPGTWNARPSGNAPVHVDAAARATALAVSRGEPGLYNVVDDGGAASNAKARARLGWDPVLR